jgi:hypothetical protein
MKRNSIIFTFVGLFILLLSNTSYGGDSYAMSSPVQSTSSIQISDNSNVCLSTEYAKKLVVDLKKYKLQEKALISCTSSNIELSQQVSLLREEVELLQQKYEITNNLLLKNEEIYKQKYDVLNDELTEAKKPRWGSLITSGALGAVLMGLAIIIL